MGQQKKEDTDSEKNMPLSGHLKELRNRIVICLVCLAFFFIIGLQLAPRLVQILQSLGEPYGYHFVVLSPQELLLEYFSIAFLTALVLTVPLILYHLWAFIRPGLKKNENRLFALALLFGLLCFALGLLFAYRIMLPFMLRFLIELGAGTTITASISIQNYITFLLTMFLIFGIVFELPVLTVLLTQLGLVQVKWLKKGRKVVIVLIFVIAAFITPPDMISQIMTALPMLVLYEFSIVLCSSLMHFRNKEREEK